MASPSVADTITDIATKRGFFFPTAEIYNAPAGFWTYGHLGKTMKHQWESLWRSYFLGLDENYIEIEGSCILPQQVFHSSGHLKNFNDPLTSCKKCSFRFRADHLLEDELGIHVEGLSTSAMDKLIQDNKLVCPKCSGALTEVKWFNMMFDVRVGAVGNDVAYLSPETAQNPFLAFKREFMAMRERLPLGIAMIGKAFRNEVSPRQGFFRLREFTQAELQIFFDPDTLDTCPGWNSVKDITLKILFATPGKKEQPLMITCAELHSKKKIPQFYAYHLAKIQTFYLDILRIPLEKFRFRELGPEERAFYNNLHFDVELDFKTLGGFKEVGGCHYRTDHDLKGHMDGSGEKLEVFIEGKRFIPHDLELSFGVDRNIWALVDLFFKEEKERTLFTFPPHLAPISVAVFPLVNKDGLPEKAQEVYATLKQHFKTFYDSKGSIGKMYRRMDEIGCPFMITIDHQTLKDQTVTVRRVADMQQTRVSISKLVSRLQQSF